VSGGPKIIDASVKKRISPNFLSLRQSPIRFLVAVLRRDLGDKPSKQPVFCVASFLAKLAVEPLLIRDLLVGLIL
jgi:hypothetical protein